MIVFRDSYVMVMMSDDGDNGDKNIQRQDLVMMRFFYYYDDGDGDNDEC